MDIKVVLH